MEGRGKAVEGRGEAVERTVETGAATLRCRVEGRGDDLLLVHGVGGDLEAWDGVVAALKGAFRTVRFDLRGHGRSSRPAGALRLDDFVADTLAVMDAFGIGRCHLAGHSLGGLIAQEMALGHPGRIGRLVLLSTVAGRNREERRAVAARLAVVADGAPGDHFQRSLPRWFSDRFLAAHPERIAALAARNRANDPASYAAAYRVLATTDLARRLPGIRAPTLVATGDGDVGSNPRMAKLMHEAIAGSSLHIFGDLRHAVLEEAPGRVAALLAAFLREG